jgi:hypothetical protein
MSTEGLLAYLSAAPGDAAWAAALHRDLERCLDYSGVTGRVFWEAEDVPPGVVVAGAQQEGVDRARCFLLVVTAEALADRRVTDLWQSFHRLARPTNGCSTLRRVSASCGEASPWGSSWSSLQRYIPG